MNSCARLTAGVFSAALMLATAGCGAGGGGNSTAAAPALSVAGATGRAMGGEQAITGATVKLMRVNTDGSAATSLYATTTDSNGYFTLTGKYSCTAAPTTAASDLYVTVTGGNSGGLGSNPGIALMAPLGQCGSLSSSIFVVVNEVTTVATVWALQQFMGVTWGVAGAEDIAINTTAQSATGLQSAFATVPVMVTLSQGAAASSYSNATIEAAKINTIANILTACVNSSGTGQCADLFAAATPTDTTPTATVAADTVQAALYMAQNPFYNIAQLYAYQTG